MRLYIIRHGEPAYPEDRLTPKGHSQAREIADRLADAEPRRLCSSPMRRAVQSASYTAERLGLELEIEDWMAEREGWVLADPSAEGAPVWQIDPAQVRSWSVLRRGNGHPFKGLELPGLGREIAELGRLSDEFLAGRGCRREGSGYSVDPTAVDLAIFCHCGFALTWLAHLLELPPPMIWAGFTLYPGSLTTIEFERGTAGHWAPRCSGLGETAHLSTLC